MRQIPVFHIDDGESLMFPVDAQHAVGAHPFEWSKVPWTEETAAAARKARDAQEQGKAAPLQPIKPIPPVDTRVKDGKSDPGSPVAERVSADNDKAAADAKGAGASRK